MPKNPARSARWVESQKGQVLIIFALTAVVLLAIMGLAVDAGISYLHSDQQEKAAEAAALSGVSYLPGDAPDATSDAVLTAQRDGYTVGGTGSTAVTVSVTQPSGTTNQLTVAITAPAPVYFLELLGFGEHEVSRKY
jgi:Flp pilus assembly protein TadG